MNKTIGIIIVVIVIIGGLYLLTSRAPKVSDTGSDVGEQSQNASSEGRVIFSVTDAAADMSAISEINMTVRSVDIHSEASGWATVSTTPQDYNLLALNASGESEILADVTANAGTYDQVRLNVDSIKVTTKAGATKEAKLPSSELKINTRLVVNANATSSINFDFLADKSLHVTGNGQYIFSPVVKTETKSNAEVNVNVDGTVVIAGGQVDDTNTVGMDIDGSVKVNFELKANQKLNIDSNNVIKLEL